MREKEKNVKTNSATRYSRYYTLRAKLKFLLVSICASHSFRCDFTRHKDFSLFLGSQNTEMRDKTTRHITPIFPLHLQLISSFVCHFFLSPHFACSLLIAVFVCILSCSFYSPFSFQFLIWFSCRF